MAPASGPVETFELGSPFSPQLGTIQVELSQNGGPETLDEILLDPSSGGHQAVNELVLRKESDDLPETRGDEVRGVAKKEGERFGRIFPSLSLLPAMSTQIILKEAKSTISSTMCMALAKPVAWKPMVS